MKQVSSDAYNDMLRAKFTKGEVHNYTLLYQCATDQLDFAIKNLTKSKIRTALNFKIEEFKSLLHKNIEMNDNTQHLADFNDAYDELIGSRRYELLKAYRQYNLTETSRLLMVEFWSKLANRIEFDFNKEIYKRSKMERIIKVDSITDIEQIVTKHLNELERSPVRDSQEIKRYRLEIYKQRI